MRNKNLYLWDFQSLKYGIGNTTQLDMTSKKNGRKIDL